MTWSQSSLLHDETRREATSEHARASLERLRRTARTEIDRHVKQGDRCAICGTPFPCDRAVLADTALGLF
jgi:hypothetical protein